MVGLPFAGILFVYMRELIERYFEPVHRQLLAGSLGTLAVYAAVQAALAGFYSRVGVIIVLVGMAVLAVRGPQVPSRWLCDRGTLLAVLPLATLLAAYLYRSRVTYVYYVMDFLPLLAVACGVLYLVWWDRLEPDRGTLRAVVAVVLIVALVSSTAATFPFTESVTGPSSGWLTMDRVDEHQSDLSQRVEGDGPVISGSPAYVAGTDIRLLNDRPRAQDLASRGEGTAFGARVQADLQAAMTGPDPPLVISSAMTREMFSFNRTTVQVFEREYCRVPDTPLYNQTSASLYRPAESCPPDRRPTVQLDR
jgi:hypothetical protein